MKKVWFARLHKIGETHRVLMVAWMNAEALQKTVETGLPTITAVPAKNNG